MNKEKQISQKLKNGLKIHEIMRDYTTMKIGGVADFFYDANTVDDLILAVKSAKELSMPYVVLGWGSNIIFSDYGFPGLVIKNSTSNISYLTEKSQVITDSGLALAKLILGATSHNLSGLEFLFGVPGTCGGAVYGNAGAYGQSIGDFVKQATVLMPGGHDEEAKVVQLDREWFDFSYRSSRLKKIEGMQKPIILTIKFQLAQNRQEEIMRRLNSYKQKRAESQPIGRSCGSVFKNSIPDELENVSGYGSSGMPEVPQERTAGYLLEKSGAKKLRINHVRVSSRHANFIINEGNAKAHEARQLIEEMRAQVKKKFSIDLHEEIEYIGQW